MHTRLASLALALLVTACASAEGDGDGDGDGSRSDGSRSDDLSSNVPIPSKLFDGYHLYAIAYGQTRTLSTLSCDFGYVFDGQAGEAVLANVTKPARSGGTAYLVRHLGPEKSYAIRRGSMFGAAEGTIRAVLPASGK